MTPDTDRVARALGAAPHAALRRVPAAKETPPVIAGEPRGPATPRAIRHTPRPRHLRGANVPKECLMP